MQASYQVLERPAFNVGYLGMNQKSGSLGNQKFREAIAYALNRRHCSRRSTRPARRWRPSSCRRPCGATTPT